MSSRTSRSILLSTPSMCACSTRDGGTMSSTTDDAGHATGADAQMGMMAMYDLAAPQPRYLELLAQGGYVEAMEGLGLSFNRANTEYVLRHADEFSSRVEMSL